MQKQASCQHNESKNTDTNGNGMIQVGDIDVNKNETQRHNTYQNNNLQTKKIENPHIVT
jgi:hypothetical protein